MEQCLLSVLHALKEIDGEIIVIDNKSEDGSFEFFQNRFPPVKFVWNTRNIGFAKANNQALKMANGQYILFLNPDTILPEDCLEKSIDFIRSGNNEVALGIKMVDGSGNFLKESKRAFPSPITSFYKLSGLSKLFPRSPTFSKYHLGNLSKDQNQKVDILAGAFMMIPRTILDKTGGFDEQYFMYGEDIDLSYRIQKAGFTNYYFAGSTIVHFKGESTKKGSLNYVKMFYSAMSIFVKKHYGTQKAGLYSLFLHMAISFSGTLSAISKLGKILPIRRNKRSLNKTIVVIAASEIEFEEVKRLLNQPSADKQIAGRIATDNILNSQTIGSIHDLTNVFSYSGAREIILCQGQLSFKQIITLMQRIPKKVSVKVFAKGSHAIIGSDNKDLAGDVILKQGA